MKLRTLIAGVCLGAAAYAHAADNCEITIQATDTMQFQKDGKKLDEIVAPQSCGENFTVKLVHTGKLPRQAMGHNWVLSTKSDMNEVVSGSIKLGPQPEGKADLGYTPQTGAFNGKVLASSSKLLGGGESDSFKVDLSKLEAKNDYVFYCTFPGHSGIMQGKFTVEPAKAKQAT